MQANEVCQGSLRAICGVSQREAILQVVDGQHNHSEPFLNGFKRSQAEIAQSEGVLQVEVINFHRPALLIRSQDLLHTQSQIGADEVLGELVPGAFLRDDRVDRLSEVFQVATDATCVIPGSFVMFVHSLERDALIRLVPERPVVLVNPYLVNPPVGLDGTDDMPLLSPTELDQFLGSVSGVKEHVDFVTLG